MTFIIAREKHRKGVKAKPNVYYIIYKGEYVSGELKSVPNEALRWFRPEELVGLNLSPSVQKLLGLLGKWKNKFMFNYGLHL